MYRSIQCHPLRHIVEVVCILMCKWYKYLFVYYSHSNILEASTIYFAVKYFPKVTYILSN